MAVRRLVQRMPVVLLPAPGINGLRFSYTSLLPSAAPSAPRTRFGCCPNRDTALALLAPWLQTNAGLRCGADSRRHLSSIGLASTLAVNSHRRGDSSHQVNFGIYQSNPTAGAAGTATSAQSGRGRRRPLFRGVVSPDSRRRCEEYRSLMRSAPRPAKQWPCLPSPLLSAQLQPSQSAPELNLRAAGAVLSPSGRREIRHHLVIHHHDRAARWR